jgi:hypothetical protein
MFEHWDSYYILIGSASGALIGLLFVVATLQSGRDPEESARGASIYITPTVLHFTVVLVVSAMASAPGLSRWAAGLVPAAAAIVGLFNAGRAMLHIGRGTVVAPHWTDFWCYGVAPLLGYLGLALAAIAIAAGAPCAAYVVAADLMVLLLIGIRNAWDLVTWLAPRAPKL